MQERNCTEREQERQEWKTGHTERRIREDTREQDCESSREVREKNGREREKRGYE